MESPPASIKAAKSPWLNLPVTTYMLPFISSPPLLDHAYAPLEAASPFASAESSGAFKGGLGMMQIVRYHDSPVGAYDELLLVPGYFEVPGAKKNMVRVTRIYVSQKDTCWNGRHNWNVPKHLARFSFKYSGNSVSIEVFASQNDAQAFVKFELASFHYLPAIPFSTNMSKYVGLDTTLAQPPLPAAKSVRRKGFVSNEQTNGGEEESDILCGTEEWKIAVPEVWGRAKCCWISLNPTTASASEEPGEQQPLLGAMAQNVGSSPTSKENVWWPAYKPWRIGLWVENGKINFKDGFQEGIGRS